MQTHKHYINLSTKESATSASAALKWYKAGDDLKIVTLDECMYVIRSRVLHGKKSTEESRQEKTDRENRDHCKRIAEDLEAYANGRVYKCPECGDEIIFPDGVGDKFKCTSCGRVADVDEYEQLSLYDFFSDTYDIEYRIGSDRAYRSVCIMVACGGPNIYIDTGERAVQLFWWCDHAEYPLLSDTVEAVDEWAEDLFNCY